MNDGYCEHNRRPPRCWECQCERAVKAETRVYALSEDHAMVWAGADADALVIGNLNARVKVLEGAIARLHYSYTHEVAVVNAYKDLMALIDTKSGEG